MCVCASISPALGLTKSGTNKCKGLNLTVAKGWTNSLGVTVTKGCIEANVILVLARVQISRLGLYFYEEGDLSLELL